METVNVRCGACGELIGLSTADLGHQVQCPLCRQVILASAPSATEQAVSDAAGPEQSSTPASEPATQEEIVAASSPDAAADESTVREGEFDSPFEVGSGASVYSDNDSVFAPPEDSSDDLFGEVSPPQLGGAPASERVDAIASSPAPMDADETELIESTGEGPPVSEDDDESTQTFSAELSAAPGEGTESTPPGAAAAPEDETAQAPVVNRTEAQHEHSEETGHWIKDHADAGSVAAPAAAETAEAGLRRPAPQPSMFVPVLLIFLIPYSIITTCFLIYILYTQRNANKDPDIQYLEKMLEDSFRNRNKKAIQRIKHDLPVPENLRTKLGEPLEVGAVQVTPLRVVLNPHGDLTLYLRLKNISGGSNRLKFNPLPSKFAEFDREEDPAVKPYIFLESADTPRLYGAKVGWFSGPVGRENVTLDTKLEPGEEMTVSLTTVKEDRASVLKVLAAESPLTWRVHLRRGLEKLHNQDWVITCVVGVEFSADQIRRP